MTTHHQPPTPRERRDAGRALRKVTPRSSLEGWTAPARRGDPLRLLTSQDRVRITELVPIRYGRMSVSPFTFLRGSAAVMARDLASRPSTGIRVQCCGDCHLLNFGAYATPERNLVFDVNDFDETLEAPFEWDLLRLGASLHVAALDNGFTATDARSAVLRAVAQYRMAMARLAGMSDLAVWYARVDVPALDALVPPDRRKAFRRGVRKARSRDNMQALGKLGTISADGSLRIADQPPLIEHVDGPSADPAIIAELTRRYRGTLQDDRARLLDRYRFRDSARKVVGVGSVGTDSRVALFTGADDSDPLFLQMKEARASVLAPYAGASPFRHQGQRVVEGQRLMQAASDMFLGWYSGTNRRHYYVRQLRDMKASADVATMNPGALAAYAALCGGTLAYCHARSGDACIITGYLGSGTAFDEAIAGFSAAYAVQTTDDHARLIDAIDTGRITAKTGV